MQCLTTPLPQSTFITEPVPFTLDEERFLADIADESLPVFLSDPSDAFLSATDLVPIVEVLTRY